MPVHDFVAEDGEAVSVYVAISAPAKEHQQQKIGGKLFRRVYGVPLMAKDVKRGDATEEDFLRVTTGKQNMTVGEMHKISAEMSAARADRHGGNDPVKEQYYRQHERERGEKHPEVVRREAKQRANERLAELGMKINW